MIYSSRALKSVLSVGIVAAFLVATPITAQPAVDGNTTPTATAAASSASQPVVLHMDDITRQLTADESATNGLRQKMIHSGEDTSVVLLSFEANGKKDNHQVPGTATIHVVEGSIDFEVLGKTHALETGNIIILQPNTEHNLTAKERSRVLVTINK